VLFDMATCVVFVVAGLFIMLTNVKDSCMFVLMELLLTLAYMD
jgi:hypothetical protein